MAAILLSACSVLHDKSGEFHKVMIITPATADSADTIDISGLVQDGQLLGIGSSWDVEAGDAVTCTYAIGTGIITIDAAGGTSNHTYAIEIKYVDYTIAP